MERRGSRANSLRRGAPSPGSEPGPRRPQSSPLRPRPPQEASADTTGLLGLRCRQSPGLPSSLLLESPRERPFPSVKALGWGEGRRAWFPLQEEQLEGPALNGGGLCDTGAPWRPSNGADTGMAADVLGTQHRSSLPLASRELGPHLSLPASSGLNLREGGSQHRGRVSREGHVGGGGVLLPLPTDRGADPWLQTLVSARSPAFLGSL